MEEHESLATDFEAHRARLQGVAYRMLGSRSEAEDAVQETWLKLRRAGTTGVENLGGWLTTVISRVCLDLLRSRKSRREAPGQPAPEPVLGSDDLRYPEHETLRVDQVGQALMVVLQTLPPAERVAFVLHDLFDLPFAEIAAIVDRTPTAARQLASRARRRVEGAPAVQGDPTDQRAVIDAFLTAARGGDLQALIAVLAPDVVFQADPAAVKGFAAPELRGAEAVARTFVGRAQAARPAIMEGELGLAVLAQGRIFVLLHLTILDGTIAEIQAITDPEQLARLEVTVLDG